MAEKDFKLEEKVKEKLDRAKEKTSDWAGVLTGIDYASPVTKARAEVLAKALEEQSGHQNALPPNLLADIYHSMYLPIPITSKYAQKKHQLEREVVDTFLNADEVNDLRRHTIGDKYMSEETALAFGEKFIEALKEMEDKGGGSDKKGAKEALDKLQEDAEKQKVERQKEKKEEEKSEKDQENMENDGKEKEQESEGNNEDDAEEGEEPKGIQKLFKALRGDKGKKEEEISEDVKRAVEKAVEQAVPQATEKMNTLKDLKDLVGFAPGGNGCSADEEKSMKSTLRQLAEDAEIKEILKFLASMKGFEAKSEKYTPGKHGELLGYERGHDPEMALASEFAMPDDVFFQKFADGELTQHQKGLREQSSPIYVLIDTSGSMAEAIEDSGTNKEVWAKSVALSLYMRAKKEHRNFLLREFESYVSERKEVRRGSVKDSVDMVNYIVNVSPGGGTNLQQAIITAANDITNKEVKEVGQIVVITDGIASLNVEAIKEELKKANASVIAVMIGYQACEELKQTAKDYLQVTRMDESNALTVVDTTKERARKDRLEKVRA